MKITNQLNVSQICSVRSYVNRVTTNYIYKKAKTTLFFWKRKEGFYSNFSFDNNYVTVEEIEKEGIYKIINEQVYYKPYVRIRMSNNEFEEKIFETEKELYDFMNSDEMKSVNWIKS